MESFLFVFHLLGQSSDDDDDDDKVIMLPNTDECGLSGGPYATRIVGGGPAVVSKLTSVLFSNT